MIEFQWDENKNKINVEKHGIDFKEAMTVFLDEEAILICDDEHSEGEERFILLGFSSVARLLVVCHCYREKGKESIIRLISARKATKKEINEYVRRI